MYNSQGFLPPGRLTGSVLQVASCERTRLPMSEDAATVQHLLSQQQQSEAAMQVVKLGSRSGAKAKRTSGKERVTAFASLCKHVKQPALPVCLHSASFNRHTSEVACSSWCVHSNDVRCE